MRNTDMMAEEKQFSEQVVHVDRVARVVKGGRRFRFRALLVIGDGKGQVGVGSSKGADVSAAVTKATDVAKKSLVKISLNRATLPHEVSAKVSGAQILIKPAAPGTGLIAGGVVRTVLEAVGISDALSKSLGSSNKTNLAYATVKALQSAVPQSDWVVQKTSQKPAVKSAKPANTHESELAAKPKKAATKVTKDTK